ncbi:site-specific integrase [Rhodococcoides fascians]|uniref:site-specific integrase n=1 Tax=Rhodococcoides fascians TaxID=1828 RepID=UPI0023F8F8A0
MWEPQTTRNNVYLGLQRTGNANSMTLNPHALRHKFATELVNNGCSPEMLRRQLRHHDVTVSLKYYVETEEHKLVDKIESTFGGMR